MEAKLIYHKPSSESACVECSGKLHILGPKYDGKLLEKKIVNKILIELLPQGTAQPDFLLETLAQDIKARK